MRSDRRLLNLALAALLAGLFGVYAYAGKLALTPHAGDLYRMYYIDRTLAFWPERTGLRYTPGRLISFDEPVEYEKRPGWSYPEPQGTWTNGPEAGLLMTLAAGTGSGPLVLTANLSAFVNEHHPAQSVEIEANGAAIGRWDFRDAEPPGLRTATIPKGSIGESGVLDIDFKIVDPVSPRALGIGGDRRKLGLLVRSITLNRAP